MEIHLSVGVSALVAMMAADRVGDGRGVRRPIVTGGMECPMLGASGIWVREGRVEPSPVAHPPGFVPKGNR
jgi:hypothetical protein